MVAFDIILEVISSVFLLEPFRPSQVGRSSPGRRKGGSSGCCNFPLCTPNTDLEYRMSVSANLLLPVWGWKGRSPLFLEERPRRLEHACRGQAYIFVFWGHFEIGQRRVYRRNHPKSSIYTRRTQPEFPGAPSFIDGLPACLR